MAIGGGHGSGAAGATAATKNGNGIPGCATKIDSDGYALEFDGCIRASCDNIGNTT